MMCALHTTFRAVLGFYTFHENGFRGSPTLPDYPPFFSVFSKQGDMGSVISSYFTQASVCIKFSKEDIR